MSGERYRLTWASSYNLLSRSISYSIQVNRDRILSVDWQYTLVRLFVIRLTMKYLQRYLFGFRSPWMSSYSFWYLFCSKIVRSSADSDLPFWNRQTATLCLWRFCKCEFSHLFNFSLPLFPFFLKNLCFIFRYLCFYF